MAAISTRAPVDVVGIGVGAGVVATLSVDVNMGVCGDDDAVLLLSPVVERIDEVVLTVFSPVVPRGASEGVSPTVTGSSDSGSVDLTGSDDAVV